MSPSLAACPLVRFTREELEYWGDGIPRDFGGRPLPWVAEIQAEIEVEKEEERGRTYRS